MLILYIADAERDAGMKNLSRKEALEVLNGMKVKIEIPKAAVMQNKRNAALDMAIEALKYSEIPNSSNDCISRQAAIELIERMKPYHQDADDIAEMIANVPSAQPEQRWIPCSERLPKVYDSYLITTYDGNVDIGTIDPKKQGVWSACDADGFYWLREVTAWMPLPEPWKGEQP